MIYITKMSCLVVYAKRDFVRYLLQAKLAFSFCCLSPAPTPYIGGVLRRHFKKCLWISKAFPSGAVVQLWLPMPFMKWTVFLISHTSHFYQKWALVCGLLFGTSIKGFWQALLSLQLKDVLKLCYTTDPPWSGKLPAKEESIEAHLYISIAIAVAMMCP